MMTDGLTAESGPVVAHRRLGEPERRFIGKDTRPVPEELFPGAEQALVLRTDTGLVAMDWGQIPDPGGTQWVKARAATLVRRRWTETVTLEVPSQSPDRRFRVRAILRGTLTSAVSYLSADSVASAVYHDEIGTTARDLGKDFDALHSAEYETTLRARLTGWIRVRRNEVPGVEMELGLVEVTPPDTAIQAHDDLTSTRWKAQKAEQDRTYAERDLQADHQRDVLIERLRNERDELHARLQHRERTAQAERDDDFLSRARDATHRQGMADRERRANESAVDYELRLIEQQRQADLEDRGRGYELRGLKDELHVDAARLEIEQQRDSAKHQALISGANDVAGLLQQPHGTEAYGLTTGKVDPGTILEAQLESTRESESKFYALLVYLIEHDQSGDLELGDAAKQMIMMEMQRLGAAKDGKPPIAPAAAKEPPASALDSASVIETDPLDG